MITIQEDQINMCLCVHGWISCLISESVTTAKITKIAFNCLDPSESFFFIKISPCLLKDFCPAAGLLLLVPHSDAAAAAAALLQKLLSGMAYSTTVRRWDFDASSSRLLDNFLSRNGLELTCCLLSVWPRPVFNQVAAKSKQLHLYLLSEISIYHIKAPRACRV